MNTGRRILLTVIALFAGLVFVVDLLTPVGVEVWVLYLPVILAAVLFNHVPTILAASAGCSLFVIIGTFFSPLEIDPTGQDILNRGMGLTALWMMTIAGITIVRRSAQVAQTMESLKVSIDRHQRAEKALAESEERLRLAVAGAGMGTWDVNLRTGEAVWSQAPFRIIGFDPAQGGEANWDMWLSEDHADELGAVLAEQEPARSEQSLHGAEIRIRRPSTGEIVWLQLFGRFVYEGLGNAVRFTGVSFDITQRKKLEREVLDIAAREQRRLGVELHDGVAQELTGLSLIANSLAKSLSDSQEAKRIADRLVAGIRRVHEQVRDLSHGMLPFQIEAGGLRAALADLAARASEQSGIPIAFECPELIDGLDATAARQLIRITQEAVNNAIRHAKPRRIRLSLGYYHNGLRLVVQDDGPGMSKTNEPADGMGIRIMRYRAGLIGGVLRIEGREGRGTVVTCTVPRRQGDGEERRDGAESRFGGSADQSVDRR